MFQWFQEKSKNETILQVSKYLKISIRIDQGKHIK